MERLVFRQLHLGASGRASFNCLSATPANFFRRPRALIIVSKSSSKCYQGTCDCITPVSNEGLDLVDRVLPSVLKAKTAALALVLSGSAISANAAAEKVTVTTPAELFPLTSVRLLESPFTRAVEANREYCWRWNPGSPARAVSPGSRIGAAQASYGNWESGGLDGHTAGHYLSALADMIASGDDTPDGELRAGSITWSMNWRDARRPTATVISAAFPAVASLGKVAAGHIEARQQEMGALV